MPASTRPSPSKPRKTSPPEGARPVVLIGLMGAGKSRIGRMLAERMGVPFTDSDLEIEAAAGCTVQEIFEVYGEPAFRDAERRVMARLLDQGPGVIATGGGAFMNAETRALIRERAVSVWLRADLDLLVARTAGKTKRPLLNRGNPRDTLARLIRERHPTYAEADITVDTADEPAEAVTDRVFEALTLWRERLRADAT